MKRRALALVLLSALIFSVVINVPFSASAEVVIGNTYYDIDLETGASSGVWPNKASSGMYFGYQGSPSGYNPPQTPVDDSTLGSKVMKIDIPSAFAHDYAQYIGGWGLTTTGLSSSVSWYEISLRFDTGFQTFRITKKSAGGGSFPNQLLTIDSYGEITIGAATNAEVNNLTIVPDTWYHFVIAIDSIDKVNESNSKIYAWVNGTLLTTSQSVGNNYTVANALNLADDTDALCMQTHRGSGDFSIYVDNIKWYTSTNSVAASGYDPMSKFETPTLTSEKLNISANKIYIPDGETISELLSMVSGAESGVRCVKGGNTVPEADFTRTPAVGAQLFVSAPSGKIGVATYIVEDGLRLYDAKRSEAVWKNQNGTITAASGLAINDALTLELDFVNDTLTEQTGTLVVVAYSDDDLIGYTFTDMTVPVGGTTTPIVSNPLTITSTTDLTVKAYIWESESRKVSQMLGLALD